MRRTLARVVLAAVLAAPLAAQSTTLSIGVPRDAGMSDSLLQQGIALYRSAVDSGHLVGAVLFVARHGKVVLHETIGLRNRDAGLPMEKATLFRMASNTKPVVATAVAILAERGKLRYTDSVFRYIPSFDTDLSRGITIGQLLSHTSGFRINTLFLQPMMQRSRQHPDAPSLQLEVARFGGVGPKVTPGTAYAYSNPGFNTLGAIIEIVSGQPLDVFLRNEIYAKLDMRDTYNHEVAGKLDGKLSRMGAVYYRRDTTTGQWIAGWKPGDKPQVPFVRASGGLISTAWDYAVFLQTFLNGGTYGATRILSPQSVEALTIRHTPADGQSYGYGWVVDSTGGYSHSGSDGTYAWVDPLRGIIGMVLTQTPSGRNPRARFVELVNRAVEAGSRVDVTAPLERQYAGALTVIHDKVLALAIAIPADKYSWRPSEKVRTVSQVLMHMAGEWFYLCPVSVGDKPPADFGAPGQAMRALESITSKPEVIAQLRRSWAHCRSALERIDSARLVPDSLPARMGFPRVTLLVSGDQHEHVGQLIAYARSIGVTPPWSK